MILGLDQQRLSRDCGVSYGHSQLASSGMALPFVTFVDLVAHLRIPHVLSSYDGAQKERKICTLQGEIRQRIFAGAISSIKRIHHGTRGPVIQRSFISQVVSATLCVHQLQKLPPDGGCMGTWPRPQISSQSRNIPFRTTRSTDYLRVPR